MDQRGYTEYSRGMKTIPRKKIAAKRGSGLKFIHDNVDFERDECLIWPFGGNDYGHFQLDGVTYTAHRYMCRLAHGDPPFGSAVAAHSCGKSRCINPNHLYWATETQNNHDRYKHGTMPMGEKSAPAKLKEADILEIFNSTESTSVLGERYGVSGAQISRIKNGVNWSWLTSKSGVR